MVQLVSVRTIFSAALTVICFFWRCRGHVDAVDGDDGEEEDQVWSPFLSSLMLTSPIQPGPLQSILRSVLREAGFTLWWPCARVSCNVGQKGALQRKHLMIQSDCKAAPNEVIMKPS